MQLVDLAFLAPDVVVRILEGRQPTGLTSDHLIKRGFPYDWGDRRHGGNAGPSGHCARATGFAIGSDELQWR